MASNTYVALASAQGTGSSGTITFNSIPSTYTDLRIVLTGTETNATLYEFDMRYNNDSGNNYSLTYLQGNGSSASSGRYSSTNKIRLGEAGTDTTLPTLITIDVMNYANTTTYKTAIIRYNEFQSGAGDVGAKVALWRGSTGSSTEAITRIDLLNLGGNFTTSTTATLYGVAAAAAPTAKATGGTITYDVGYTYHTFTSNGTFTPLQTLSCDVLIAAGGGGAGGNSFGSGAGGAGGLVYLASQTMTATGYAATIGGGGSGNGTAGGTSGSNSTLGAFTTAVGGGGAGNRQSGAVPGANGGSGGGGFGGGSAGGTGGGSGTSGQGNAGAGGTGGGSGNQIGGGGGGAGAAGANPTGGAGLAYYGNTYSVGGTGMTNGTGPGTSGAANTGNGGSAANGSGGSGIIIVRYAN